VQREGRRVVFVRGEGKSIGETESPTADGVGVRRGFADGEVRMRGMGII
jgi:hypothetical protein